MTKEGQPTTFRERVFHATEERLGMDLLAKDRLAAKLTGREYGSEITDAEEGAAKRDGLVVLFGYSDDNAELRGAIHDEIPCYGGGDLYLTRAGPIDLSEDCPRCHRKAVENAKRIEALWNKEAGYSWTYKTYIPHATFEIVEEGEPYCRGIVFELDALPEPLP